MPLCTAKKDDGSPCERIVGASQTLCFSHDPEQAATRSKNASVAGRAKATDAPELREIKRVLRKLFADLERGAIDPKLGSTLVSVANSQMRAVSLEAELTHHAELGRKLAKIEEMDKAARRWAN